MFVLVLILFSAIATAELFVLAPVERRMGRDGDQGATLGLQSFVLLK